MELSGLDILVNNAVTNPYAMDASMATRAEPLGVRWFLPKHELVRLPELLDELLAT